MRKKIAEIINIVGGEWLGQEEELERIVETVSTDSRNIEKNALFVPIIGEKFDGHRFVLETFTKGAVLSFWKRGHLQPPPHQPLLLVDDPVAAMQQLAKAYLKEVGCKVIAVTGSVGKTTTKDMIAALLKRKYITHANAGNFNNHIGLPLTLLSMPENTEVVVLEMGMNHFGEIELLSQIANPDLAVITNIGESHIEHLKSRAGIAQAKLEILAGMNHQGVLFYPHDEPLIVQNEAFQRFKGMKRSCGLTPDADVSGRVKKDLGLDGFLLEDLHTHMEYSIPIPGIHNAQNSLYALGVVTFLQMEASEIKKGFQQLSLSKMRMEKKRGRNGVTIINDAYNASPLSIRAALNFFDGITGWKRKIVVLGDIGELGQHGPQMHKELGKELSPSRFPIVYLTGELMKHALEGAQEEGFHQVIHFDDKEALTARLRQELNPETIILFKASRFMQFEKIVDAIT